MATPNPKAGVGVVGVGAAACAACCAGPIVGFLAATGIASAVGAVTLGATGLLAALALAAVLRRRRNTRSCAAPPSGPVTLAGPQVRPPVAEPAGGTPS